MVQQRCGLPTYRSARVNVRNVWCTPLLASSPLSTQVFELAEKRAQEKRAQEKRAQEIAEKTAATKDFAAGDVVAGVVKSLHVYGAMVDIGGARGLLHISQITETRLSTVDEVHAAGGLAFAAAACAVACLCVQQTASLLHCPARWPAGQPANVSALCYRLHRTVGDNTRL